MLAIGESEVYGHDWPSAISSTTADPVPISSLCDSEIEIRVWDGNLLNSHVVHVVTLGRRRDPWRAEKAKVIQEQSISALCRDGISSLEIFPSPTVRWRVLVLLVLLLLKEGLINSGELPASTSFCPTKATPRWFICPCFQRPQLPIQQPLVFLVLHPTREIIIQTIQLIKSHTSQDARRLQQMGMPSSLNFPPGSPPPLTPSTTGRAGAQRRLRH